MRTIKFRGKRIRTVNGYMEILPIILLTFAR